jgi:type I restriction enzyme S subunit
MSFPRYESYKDSGVEWLKDIPSHWDDMPLKAIASHNDEVLDERTADDYEILYVDISSVDGTAGIVAKEAMPFSVAPSRARRRVKHGDVIVSTVRTYLRAIARVCEPENNLVVSTGFAVVRPSERIYHGFLGYLLSSSYFVDAVISHSVGVSYPAINASELVGIKVPLPSIPEQQTIAAFLDRETAKIDALIAEQQRLIELLKEKRQAVISHAVTKGLNPDAPMKDSDIEWLGELPAHWEVKKIKFLLRRDGYKAGPFGSSLITSELSDEGNILVLTPEHVANDSLDLPYNQYLDDSRQDEMSAFFVDMNDVVFPIVGTLGRAMIISARRPGILNQRLARMSADIARLLPSYLKLILTDVDFYKRLDEIESKGAILNHITKEKLINRPVLLPPINEQEEVLAFLNRETAKLGELTAEAQQAIALLQERRTALISAAVTGKIDVRGLITVPIQTEIAA